ncbi:gliding motility protein [Lacihabitans sp. LS3-19]|uniref:gliding motility protein GldB-related protein n=1 Tax=Lacihabitans sp. LS3-19 TaxID=2487335 RepID=UPI0020CC384F|nr:gliding motility protein [Lacihabitans sp. LS3-19]MCP9768837.1 gliding motility protein [Lacihabitans sp. LS3-19]
MRTYIILFIALLTLGLGACSSEKTEESVDIRRFDREIMAVKSKAEMADLLQKNAEITKSLYRTFPDDTAFVSHIYYLSTHPETRKLFEQTDSTFGELDDLKKEFQEAFKNIKSLYPDFKSPKIVATFTGLENDLFVSDSLVIIGLESFIGPKALYRPEQPNYILRRYSKEYIVPTVIRFLSNNYNKLDSRDESFLADMLFFGKSLEFTKEMLPNTPDSLIIGFTNQQLIETWDAQDLVWAHIVDKQLLYSPDPHLKEKYFGERPNVPEIGPKCPGRIGQWLGWRIIQRYRTEKPNTTFQELMKLEKPSEILRESKYRGQIEE